MKPGKIELTGRMNRRNSAGEDPVASGNYGANRLGISRVDMPDIQRSDLIPANDPFDLPPAPTGTGANQTKDLAAASPETCVTFNHREADSPTMPTPLRPFSFEDEVSQGLVSHAARQDNIFAETESEYQESASLTHGILQHKRLFTAGAGILLLSVIYAAIRIFSASPSPATAMPVADIPAALPVNANNTPPTNVVNRASRNRFAPPARPIVKDTLLLLVNSADIESRVHLQEGRQLAGMFGEVFAAIPSWVRAPAEPNKPDGPSVGRPAPAKKFRDCPSGLRLSGIISTSAGKYATVNDRMLKIGDRINGATVVAITAFSVEMELDGENFLLGIGQGNTVAPAETEESEVDSPAVKTKDADKPSASTQPKKSKN